MGNKKNRADGPRVEVVVQDEEIWSSVFEDGTLHFGVGGVDDSGTERFRLALELEWRFAGRAEVIDGDGVSQGNVEPW